MNERDVSASCAVLDFVTLRQLHEDERLLLVEQTALCHPAVHSVELSSEDGIRVEVVVWRGSSPLRTVHDITAALGAVLPGVPVRLTVSAVAYRRRATTLLVVYK